MAQFLSLDWGTSAMRLRLIDTAALTVVAEVKSDEGISKTFAAWQISAPENQSNRLNFYLQVIQAHLQQMEANMRTTVAGLPLVVSGMASASIGMQELPYQPLPFALDGTGLTIEVIPATPHFNQEVYLVSGVRTENDVMRGEETQLIGFAAHATTHSPEQLYLFPGTHSKHIWVKQNKVIGFKTYMTGEFFSLLSKHSILSNSIAESPVDLTDAKALASFTSGVEEARGANILQVAFRVRTRELLNNITKADNYYYLSGLLIGAELEALTQTKIPVYLCGGANLHQMYAVALQKLQLPQAVHLFSPQVADEAVIRGQYQILKNLKKLI